MQPPEKTPKTHIQILITLFRIFCCNTGVNFHYSAPVLTFNVPFVATYIHLDEDFSKSHKGTKKIFFFFST